MSDSEKLVEDAVLTLTNAFTATRYGIELTDAHRLWLRERARNLLGWLVPAVRAIGRDALLAELRKQAESGDPEVAHGRADDALLAYIDDREVAEAYQAIDKWYA